MGIFGSKSFQLLVVILGASSAKAEIVGQSLIDPQSLLGAQSLSRGGATAASNLAHDALFQNPASAAFEKKYALNFGYLGAGSSLTASVVDTKSGPLGGGLFYLRRDLVQPASSPASMGNFARLEERAGFSLFGKFSEDFAVGTNIKYGYRRDYSLGLGNLSKWNFDVGARFLASSSVQLGAVAQNLVSEESGLHPRTFAFALEYRPSLALALSAQVNRYAGSNFEGMGPELGYGAGLEYKLPQGFAVSGGYRRTILTADDLVSAGLGYEASSFGLRYSLEAGVGKSRGQSHSVVLSGYL